MNYRRSSIVSVPAGSHDLVSLNDIMMALGVTDGTAAPFFQKAITRASAVIEDFCNRTLVVQSYTDTFRAARIRDARSAHIIDRHPPPLLLASWPVGAIASVAESGTALAGTDYELDPDTGELTRLDGMDRPTWWTDPKIVVAYTAGYDPIPGTVAEVSIDVVRAWWFTRSRDTSIRREIVEGVGETMYHDPSTLLSGGLTEHQQDLLASYAIPNIG